MTLTAKGRRFGKGKSPAWLWGQNWERRRLRRRSRRGCPKTSRGLTANPTRRSPTLRLILTRNGAGLYAARIPKCYFSSLSCFGYCFFQVINGVHHLRHGGQRNLIRVSGCRVLADV